MSAGLLVAAVLLLGIGAVALRSGFSQPLLGASDVIHRLVTPDRVEFDPAAATISLLDEGKTYRLAEPLWRRQGDGAALATAFPTGQAVMVWIARDDSARAAPRVVAVESAVLAVPVGIGLRAAQSDVRAARWGGAVAVLAGLYALVLVAKGRRRPQPFAPGA